MSDTGDGAFQRVGFWRRVLAWIVDLAVIGSALQIAGLLLFVTTDGRVQSSSAFISTTSCLALKAPPPGFTVPADLQANFGKDCTSSLFGVPFMRTATIGRVTKDGNVTKQVAVSANLDAQGRVVRPFDLGNLALPLLLAWRIWAESKARRSLGRRMLGIRLIGATEYASSLPILLKRYGLLIAPLTPFFVMAFVGFLAPPSAMFNIFGKTSYFGLGGVLALPALVMGILVIRDVARKRDPYFDRMAGTMVIRD